MFVSAYGAEAGNLALKVLSVGGLYVGGGIAPRILEKLKDGTFMKAFTDKGRLSQLLVNMPVRVILESRTAQPVVGGKHRLGKAAAKPALGRPQQHQRSGDGHPGQRLVWRHFARYAISTPRTNDDRQDCACLDELRGGPNDEFCHDTILPKRLLYRAHCKSSYSAIKMIQGLNRCANGTAARTQFALPGRDRGIVRRRHRRGKPGRHDPELEPRRGEDLRILRQGNRGSAGFAAMAA